MTDEESIDHWCKWHLQLYSLALGQTTFISVAGSTIHASTCKGHWYSCLNGCRSRSQAYTKSTTTTTTTHTFHKTTQEQPSTCEEGVYERKMRCSRTDNTSVQAADALRRLFTCVTFIGVKLHRRGSLRAGAGVSTRSEETEVAAHILTRVGYWRGKHKNTIRYCSEQKKVTPGNTLFEVNW